MNIALANKMRTIITVACLSVMCMKYFPAYGQEILLLGKCAGLSDDIQRLSCFDQLTEELGVEGDAQYSEKDTNWSVSVSVSPIDDSKNVVLQRIAENDFSGWLKQYRGSLVLRCKENSTDAYVVTGIQANPEYGSIDEVTATIRYDKDRAINIKMKGSTDGEALFFKRPIAEIKKMMSRKQMLFKFTPFNASPTMAVFLLTGLSESIKDLRWSCGW